MTPSSVPTFRNPPGGLKIQIRSPRIALVGALELILLSLLLIQAGHFFEDGLPFKLVVKITHGD